MSWLPGSNPLHNHFLFFRRVGNEEMGIICVNREYHQLWSRPTHVRVPERQAEIGGPIQWASNRELLDTLRRRLAKSTPGFERQVDQGHNQKQEADPYVAAVGGTAEPELVGVVCYDHDENPAQ